MGPTEACLDLIVTPFQHGKGNEGNESHEGHEEEARLCKACQASCLLRQDRQDRNRIEEDRPCADQVRQDCQQEDEPPWQEVTLDCSRPEGPQGTEDQGFRSHQEGHSTLQEGQGALCPMNALSLMTKQGAPAPDVGLSTSVEHRNL